MAQESGHVLGVATGFLFSLSFLLVMIRVQSHLVYASVSLWMTDFSHLYFLFLGRWLRRNDTLFPVFLIFIFSFASLAKFSCVTTIGCEK